MPEPIVTECAETAHIWHFVKDEADTELVITNLRRRGPLKGLRRRLFGALEADTLSTTERLFRGEWWHKGFRRKWACAKCRKIVWDYEPTNNPRPEVVR